MATINLSEYNLGELRGLHQQIELEVRNRQQAEVQKAREQIQEIARNAGISVDELINSFGKAPKKAGGSAVLPRYRNPADASQTWTGRGRQPRWVQEGLASGKAIDDFRIPNQ